jgi:two-component system, NtrC family, nitrogen regulation sensor histidine kinase GlnL
LSAFQQLAKQFAPYETLTVGILFLDTSLHLCYANTAAQNLLGFSATHGLGKPLGQILPAAAPLSTSADRALRSASTLTERELILQTADVTHKEHIFDASFSAIEWPTYGKMLLIELSDVTQRQRISRDHTVLDSLAANRHMVRQLAHEVKNPLGGIRGAAQLLQRQLVDQNHYDYTQLIIREVDRLSVLVDSISGPIKPPQRQAVNIHELCEHVYSLLRIEAPASVQIERDYDPSLPVVFLDRDQIIQVLLNLLRNALQAVSPAGRIRIRTRVHANFSIAAYHHRLVASIQIEDDGPGVPENLRTSLFHPLVTGRSEGSGLGLAVAQEIATRHGGIIEYARVVARTVFFLYLPLKS